MLGFSGRRCKANTRLTFRRREDAEKDWALFQQLRSGSIHHYQLEKRYFRSDGSLVWGRLSLSLLNSPPSPLVIAWSRTLRVKKAATGSQLGLTPLNKLEASQPGTNKPLAFKNSPHRGQQIARGL